jgi:hypothetical protein
VVAYAFLITSVHSVKVASKGEVSVLLMTTVGSYGI